MTTTYQVQVKRDVEWAGACADGQWVPACGGLLNQTGQSDEFASTFASRKEAEQIMREIAETAHDVSFRVVECDDQDPEDIVRENNKINFDLTPAASDCAEEAGVDPLDDIDALRSGEHTPESLLEFCLDGADPDREQGWREYVAAIVALAKSPTAWRAS